jgi:hypothetical protein
MPEKPSILQQPDTPTEPARQPGPRAFDGPKDCWPHVSCSDPARTDPFRKILFPAIALARNQASPPGISEPDQKPTLLRSR